MRQQLALIGVLSLSIGCSSGLLVLGQDSRNTRRQDEVPAPKAKEAKKLFKQNCAKCHGADGAGETTAGAIAGVPDFTDPSWQELSDDQTFANSIRHGVGQMPSFSKKLSNEQIKSLVSYVRTFKK